MNFACRPPNRKKRFYTLTAFAVVTFLFNLIAPNLHAQMLDLNGNGISDVWEWFYSVHNIDPVLDPDGDGYSNLQEALAGTDPLNALSNPRTSMSFSNGAVNVTILSQLGKAYQLQSLTPPATNWISESNVVSRTGTNVIFSLPMAQEVKFYRVSIYDVDTDGDGINDWEEYKLGLDPFDAFSNGLQDTNGNALGDYAFALSRLAQQNVVTISASDPVTTRPDPGSQPTDLGMFTITRGGFPLNSIIVYLSLGATGPGNAVPGVDYTALPSYVILGPGVSSTNLSVTPLANTNATTPVLATLKVFGSGPGSSASVVIYPSPTMIGKGLVGHYYTNSSSTYTNAANFTPAKLFLTRLDPAIDFIWTNGLTPNLSNGAYSVRWTGILQPQYSETYTFDTLTDDGVKLWVNDQLIINNWVTGSHEVTGSTPLQAGVLYDIKLEYFQSSGAAQAHLSWYSPSQSKQIIPVTSLYPTNSAGGSNAPSAITSALTAVGFVGQPFAFNVTGANTPLTFTAAGVPPGLMFNTTNGLLSGTPLVAGAYEVTLTASNAVGIGASVLTISIFNTGNGVVREIWTNAPGINISDIPLDTPASLTNTLGTLMGVTSYGDNYGERVRGYFTAPATGNYYFWVSGGDSVQLWISDDKESVNQVLRASVTPTNNPTPPPQYGTSPLQWHVQANQKSAWLSLVAGQKYFVQVLHKSGVGLNDNWAVGWLQDATGTNDTPTGVLPGYLLTPYYPPLPSAVPGTLYTANMLAIAGVTSDGVGSATLRVSADGTQAVLNYQVNNLAGSPTGQSINSDPYLSNPSELIFDISAAHPQADGSFLWKIKATGTLQPADILEIISEGKAFINIESTTFPNGELAGHFTAAEGTSTFTPPPTPPTWTDDHASSNAAARFLTQATFGADSNNIVTVQSLGYAGWINNQFSLPATYYLPVVIANASTDPTILYPSSDWFNAWWMNSITAPDQLRQRVAFALSEIMVISENGVLQNNALALSSYYDTIVSNCFGNYRALLEAVTLSPGMGLYLNMQGNSAGSVVTGLHANENYAREVEQLFSIGLNRVWPDGTLILNSQGNLVPTYNQSVVQGFAQVFTGWNYYQTNQTNGRAPTAYPSSANYTNPMVLVPSKHDLNAKPLLDNVVLPAAQGVQAISTNAVYDTYGSNNLHAALDLIYNNQNVGPFICRQLIQRLVTSNPSRDYLYRVTQVFNDNGSGVRGDLKAVISAIFLDYEARSTNLISQPSYGKQREPLLRATAMARAFPTPSNITGTYSENGLLPLTIVTSVPHRLNTGDTVQLTFTDTSGNAAPAAKAYSITYTNATTFSVSAPNLLSGTYGQTNGIITVSASGHGLVTNNSAYVLFTTGGAASGAFLITNVPDANHFTVPTSDLTTRSGAVLIPKIAVGGYTQSKTNVTVITTGAHGLNPGDQVFINFTRGSAPDGIYSVNTVPDATHFTIIATNSVTQTQDGLLVFPLQAPHLVRSGTVLLQHNTWSMGYTDTSGSSSLSQSPLRSPTVFNYFFPSFEFPGALASAGLTTPEFQLTSDTGVALQMNFIEGALLNNTANTNGLSSFTGGNGAIVLDINPWVSTNYTSAAGLPKLVAALNSLLAAGQLPAAAQTDIVNYVALTTNFPYSTTPTEAQMRDRVRAVIHLIVSSPDFIIQK